MVCSNCGGAGHNRRTCGNIKRKKSGRKRTGASKRTQRVWCPKGKFQRRDHASVSRQMVRGKSIMEMRSLVRLTSAAQQVSMVGPRAPKTDAPALRSRALFVPCRPDCTPILAANGSITFEPIVRVQCPCGGSHLECGTAAGAASYRAHIATDRHQNWMMSCHY